MCEITLVFTHHSENGKCNSHELYKIIESIKPEVVFLELPSSVFHYLFSDSYNIDYANSILLNRQIPDLPPEVKCIKKYKQSHNILILPVDIDPDPNLSKGQIDYMFGIFKKYEEYKKLEDELYLLMAEEGFTYLNSLQCSELFDKKWITEKNLLKFIPFKAQLYPIHELFYKEQDTRENAMLMNIYNYSRENEYSRAVFLIGAGHRNSIVHKTSEYETRKDINMNWLLYKSH